MYECGSGLGQNVVKAALSLVSPSATGRPAASAPPQRRPPPGGHSSA